jgi:DNA-directed RNA polymerase sigma subunit (sigma70/sigma32)
LIEDEAAENAFYNAMVEMDRVILRKELFRALNTVFELHETTRTYIILKYGLAGKPHTYKEIAGMYGVTIEGVRQKINRGLNQIKTSVIGVELKNKYKFEYGLWDKLEHLTKLEHKDPAWYAMELQNLRELFEAVSQ